MSLIVLVGGTLSCGGMVMVGSTKTKHGSSGVARHGDLCQFAGPCPYIPSTPPTPCPTCTIIATATKTKVDGKSVARVGDLTTRPGASLVSGYSAVNVGS